MIVIYGEVKGKGRPRFRNAGRFVQTYTPKETASYENLVKVEYQEQDGKFYDKGIPLKVDIKAYFEIPKSVSKKKYQDMFNGIIRPTKKPDADNIAKIILDALNKVAFADDTQVVDLRVRKYYSERSRVEFEIEEIK